ncbi:lysozyme inhibitor LprI family protein, partial [Neoroseomonas soli]
MIRRLVLLGLLALPLPVFAQTGPSFDCARARAWDERNICAFGDLAGLDRQIATAFRTITERASEQDRARLQGEQRAWLGERRACQGPVEREAVSCLRRVMRVRARDLEALAQAAPGGGGSSASSGAVPTAKPAAAPTPPPTALRAADCAA